MLDMIGQNFILKSVVLLTCLALFGCSRDPFLGEWNKYDKEKGAVEPAGTKFLIILPEGQSRILGVETTWEMQGNKLTFTVDQKSDTGIIDFENKNNMELRGFSVRPFDGINGFYVKN
jgi:hypothetical protein